MNIPFICDFLIDQERYIGGDSVGYKCSGKATHELSSGHLICDSCIEKLKNEPHRLSQGYSFGRENQQRIANDIVKRFVG